MKNAPTHKNADRGAQDKRDFTPAGAAHALIGCHINPPIIGSTAAARGAALADGVTSFRKTGSYDVPADDRRLRRALGRKLAKLEAQAAKHERAATALQAKTQAGQFRREG